MQEETNNSGGNGSQKVCPICYGAKLIHPLAHNGDPDYSRLVMCRCCESDLIKSRAERLKSISNMGGLSRLTFDNLLPEGRDIDPFNQQLFKQALETIKSFAENPAGWLVLSGPVGSGKTHLACAVANYRISKGHPAFYLTVSDLMDHLRLAINPVHESQYDEFFEQIRDNPLLILDNYISPSTHWAREKLDQLLEYRFNLRLPTFITTALPLDGIEGEITGHIFDPDFSRIVILRKESSALQSLDSLNLSLLKSMKFENFIVNRDGLIVDDIQNLESAYTLAHNFADSPQQWLVFQGLNGCGKTHLAAAIANKIRENGGEVLFIVVPDLLDHLRSSFNSESKVSYDSMFEKIKKIPVLVLDDFGEHSATTWAQEKLYQLINYRYNARHATIFTTFLNLDEIEDRVSSRMADLNFCTVFKIKAPDFRDKNKTTKPTVRRTRLKPQ